MNTIETVCSGLKCDNPNCDWRDDSVTMNDYEKWLNAPCPKCGENVLTTEDFLRSKSLFAITDIINSLPKEILDSMTTLSDEEIIEKMKKDPNFTEVIGLNNLKAGKKVAITVDTHGGIRISRIENID